MRTGASIAAVSVVLVEVELPQARADLEARRAAEQETAKP